MRHLRFWIICLLFILPIGMLCIGTYRFVHRIFAYLNSDARLAGTMSAEASRMLKREVRIGDVHITGNLWSLSAPNTLELSDVSIAESSKFPDGPFAHTDKAIIHYNISQLLDDADPKMPLLDEIRLIGPQLTLRRDVKGQWNYEDLPPNTIVRPFWDKLTFANGSLTIADSAFPAPSAKPPHRLATTISGLTGTALIRPDKTVAFDVAGVPEARFARDFHITGILQPIPFRASARLLAGQVNLPFFVAQFIPPTTARVASGTADLDISGLYAPPPDTPPNHLAWQALDAQGTVQLNNVTADGPQFGAPVQNIRGTLTFVDTGLNVKLTGRYADLPLNINGSVLGVTHWTELVPDAAHTPTVPPLTLALDVSAQNTDFAHAYHLLKLNQRLTAMPALVRAALQSAQAQGSVDLRLLGPLANPTISLTAHLNTLQYDMYHARNVDGRLLYADHAVNVALKGKFAEGDADVRARIEPDKNGAFLIEAHGRGLQLAKLDIGIEALQGGKGDLDIALQGERNQTPSITAQAQVLDLNVNGQTVHSLTAQAETVGRNLVIRHFRAEDPRGYAIVSGAVNLNNRTLALNVEADQLDLSALSKALVPPAPPGKGDPNAPGTPTSAPLPLAGLGYLRNGTLTGTWDNPEFHGKLSVFALQAGQDALARLDKVTADVRLTRHILVVNAGTAERYPSQAQFSGQVTEPFQPKPELAFDVSARSLDLGALIQAARLDTGKFAITGTLSTDVPIHIAGTLDALHLEGAPNGQRVRRPFAIRLQDATVNGLAIDSALAQATYDGQGLHLEHAEAHVAGGTLTASGEIPPDGPLALNIRGDNLALEQLTAALPEEPEPGLKAQLAAMTGHISLSGNIGGTMQSPAVSNAQASAPDLTYEGFPIGPVQTQADYAGKTLALHNLTVSDPTTKQPVVIAPQIEINSETKSIQTAAAESTDAIRVVNLPTQRLLDLYLHLPDSKTGKPHVLPAPAATIDGLLTGRISLSGTADDPHAEVVLQEADNHDIHVYTDYLITGLGGKATITKKGISGSQLTLSIRPIKPMAAAPGEPQAPPQEAAIVAPTFSISTDGDISADVTVSKLNLALVQQALNFDPTNALSGVAEFINITASGNIDSPELDISTVLSNILYRKEKIDRIEVSHAKVKEGLVDIADLTMTLSSAATQQKTNLYLTGQLTGFTWDAPYVPDDALLDFTAQLPHLPNARTPDARPRAEQARDWADLKILSDFGFNLSEDSQGTFLVNARVTGTRAKPVLGGSVDIVASRIKTDALQTGLGAVDGTFRLDNDRLTAEKFTAVSEIVGTNNVLLSGGNVTLTGSLPLGLGDTPRVAVDNPLTLTLTRFPFHESPLPGSRSGGVNGTADGSLRVLGTLLEPTITGQVTVSNTTATLPNQFAELPASGMKLAVNPNFRAVRLVMGNKFQLVSGNQLNAAADGYVQLDGNLANPRLAGKLTLGKGYMQLGLVRFDILPPGTVTIDYPRRRVDDSGQGLPPLPNYRPLAASQDSLSIQVDLRAQAKRVTATSLSGVSKNYQVTVSAKGSLTDTEGEAFTGKSRLALHFDTIPGDLAVSDEGVMAALAPSLIGVGSFNQIGRDPGQAFASALTNAFTGYVLPNQFDRLANAFGLDQFSFGYDPIERLSITISRQLLGPLYVTYLRSLSTSQEYYDLKFSLRFRNNYQLSYDTDEQNTHSILLEGVWRF